MKKVRKNTIRTLIAVMEQGARLISDTIWANIRYGRLDATDEHVRQAVIDASTVTLIVGISDARSGDDGVKASSG